MAFFGREGTGTARYIAYAFFHSAKTLKQGTGGTQEEGQGEARNASHRAGVVRILISVQGPEKLLENSLKNGS